VVSTSGEWTRQLLALLPPGRIWSRSGATLEALLSALGELFAGAHNRSLEIIEEADPRSTVELIDEWERIVGLPDPCYTAPTTLEVRRAIVVERLTRAGGQSPAFFVDLAASLGYTIEIDEYRPFQCGVSRCGGDLGGIDENRLYWRLRVTGPRVTYFQCGASVCSDSLGVIDEADDLECIVDRAKPAHMQLAFSYEG
jgi:uncharacterized protein YmfQ (DUF2313 family)